MKTKQMGKLKKNQYKMITAVTLGNIHGLLRGKPRLFLNFAPPQIWELIVLEKE